MRSFLSPISNSIASLTVRVGYVPYYLSLNSQWISLVLVEDNIVIIEDRISYDIKTVLKGAWDGGDSSFFFKNQNFPIEGSRLKGGFIGV